MGDTSFPVAYEFHNQPHNSVDHLHLHVIVARENQPSPDLFRVVPYDVLYAELHREGKESFREVSFGCSLPVYTNGDESPPPPPTVRSIGEPGSQHAPWPNCPGPLSDPRVVLRIEDHAYFCEGRRVATSVSAVASKKHPQKYLRYLAPSVGANGSRRHFRSDSWLRGSPEAVQGSRQWPF